jgi:CRISPR-associated endoribonuclease Cas6
MRIHLRTTKSKELVPFNYQVYLTGALHKWIGKNNLHDDRLSLYSFSWLNGGTALKQGLRFENGAHFFVSVHDQQLLKSIIQGVREKPDIAFGLVVNEIIIQEDPQFDHQQKFSVASPIFIKRRIGDQEKHFDYNEEECPVLLTETLKNKLRKANMNDNGVSVQFDLNYPSPRTKVIYYNKIGNKVSICPVIIKGTPEQILFAWNVGLGNSTGIGFGAIK